jgi:hypothetical protein
MDTVRLIQEATEAAAKLPQDIREAVLFACPDEVTQRGYTTLEWLTTVEIFRQPGESHVTAAERLALYMRAHAERWDATPTLARVQRDALTRKEYRERHHA